jgi:hypothetical protein
VVSLQSWKSSLGSSKQQQASLATEIDNAGEGEEKDENTLKLILMLLLQLSSRVRDLESCTLYTLFVPKDHGIVQAVEAAHLGYLAMVEAEGKDHKRGPPSIHRFMVLLEGVAKAEVKQGLKPLQEVANTFVADMRESSLEEVIEMVGVCKLTKAYDGTMKKLIFTGQGTVKVGSKTSCIGSVLARVLTSMGCIRKQGVAPAGFMERTLGATLEKLKA